MRLNKIKCFLSIFAFLVFLSNVNASCKPDALQEIFYGQWEYEHIGYCNINYNNMREAGCMPTSYAMIVANLTDSSVTPETIRNDICNSDLMVPVRGRSGNGPGQASYLLGSASNAVALAQKYQIQITRSGTDINEIKNNLQNGSMYIVSIKDRGGNFFTNSKLGHYIVLSNVDNEGKIVVLNPGSSKTAKGAHADSIILSSVLGSINAGIWRVDSTNTDCSKINSSGGSSNSGNSGGSSNNGPSDGRTEDYEDIFPNIIVGERQTCEGTLLNRDGSLTELGEMLEDLFLFIKILVPVIVIILTTIDYIKAIAASNDDAIKKTTKNTVIRLIVGIILFFLPYLMELLFYLFGLYDLSTCGIGS